MCTATLGARWMSRLRSGQRDRSSRCPYLVHFGDIDLVKRAVLKDESDVFFTQLSEERATGPVQAPPDRLSAHQHAVLRA